MTEPVDRTDSSQTDSISFEFDLPHAPEVVWRALTEPDLLRQWLLPATGFKLEAGAAFTFETDPHPGWDGTVSCRIVEIEPYRRISYSWSVPFLDTVVTFTLSPTPSGTRMLLEQRGFKPSQKQALGGARYGWRMMGAKLSDLLEAGV